MCAHARVGQIRAHVGHVFNEGADDRASVSAHLVRCLFAFSYTPNDRDGSIAFAFVVAVIIIIVVVVLAAFTVCMYHVHT